MPRRLPCARSNLTLPLASSRLALVVLAVSLSTVLLYTVSPARAQFAAGPVELSPIVTLDEADSAVRAHLERVRAFVADRQWDEAVETLRQVMENDGGKMIAVAPGRYLNVSDYCHLQIASLPEEALALYRQRVDPLARTWYEEALAARDARQMTEVVQRMFCSSWGDDALWALGEMELEQAHFAAARRAWSSLIELPPQRVAAGDFEAVRKLEDLPAEQAALLDQWYERREGATRPFFQLKSASAEQEVLPPETSAALVRLWKEHHLPGTRLAYPGSDINLADVRARLILVSIMEGALARAREELQAFERLHPGAEGRLAGRAAPYAESLKALVAAAAKWPALTPLDDWPTFAGSPARNKVPPRNLDLGPPAWEAISLGEPLAADSANSRAYSVRRVGEDAARLLSYHPLIVDELVLVNNQSQIFAFNARTGAPAWPGDPNRPAGEIFVDEMVAAASTRIVNRGLGVPRFTMTVSGGKLFARIGSQVTSKPMETFDHRPAGYLVCLDLEAQGRMVWKPDGKLHPDDDKWAFEGAPVVAGGDMYIAMRKSDVRPQAFVACFDVESGQLRWRTRVCSAETAGGGQLEEITNNLLTLEEDTLYYNTNLGALAALSTRDGRIRWAVTYPRAKKVSSEGPDKRTAHYYRDLNPCVYYQGKLLVAPTDAESIFALEASTGERLWETHLPEDAVHLLGVGQGALVASGDTLWWIDPDRGTVLKHWPDTSPIGQGRGVLMGNQIVWPTAGELFILDQDPRSTAAPRDPIPLAQRGAAGGNLVTAGELLLIAGPDKLYGFKQQGQPPGQGGAAVVREDAQARPPADPESGTIENIAAQPAAR